MTTEQKVIGGIVIATILILVGGVFLATKGQSSSVPEDQIISKAGIHWHPKLIINIKGEKQSFPAGIGLNGPIHNPIHTHEDATENIVHMEFERGLTKDQSKLANFFKAWGKEFSSNRILDQEATSAGMIKMFVNGAENQEFENYQMKDGDNIEIKYE